MCTPWVVAVFPSNIMIHSDILFLTGCSHGSIRLRGGTASMNGRVEVCLNGDWGTVCDDGWTTVDSNIACRQLGFSNSGETHWLLNFILLWTEELFLPQHWLTDSTAYTNAHFGQGSTIIIAINDVACTGSEATIFSCTHANSHNCAHSEDAGAQCVPRECIHEWNVLRWHVA